MIGDVKFLMKEAGIYDTISEGLEHPFASMAEHLGKPFVESKLFKPMAHLFGNGASAEYLEHSKVLGPSLGKEFADKIRAFAPASRTVAQDPNLASAFKYNKGNGIKDYIKAQKGNGIAGGFRGAGDYARQEIFGGDGVGLKNIKNSLNNEKYQMSSSTGNIFKKSLGGTIVSRGLGLGLDASFLYNGAFGKLTPGETRTGKILSNTAGLYGLRSARKSLAGFARMSLFGAIGKKVGDTAQNLIAPSMNEAAPKMTSSMSYQ